MKQNPPAQLRAWAAINLSALERNLEAIRNALPPHLRYIAVVKANAYGHGLEPIVTRLMRAQADAFAVANLDEAFRLRTVGEGWPILLLSALLPAEYEDAVRMRVRPLLSSFSELSAFSAIAARLQTPVPVHIKIDTGMGRLGIWHEEATALIHACMHDPSLQLEGICTHFSSADSDPDFTRIQRDRFLAAIQSVPNAQQIPLIHADNSAGIDSFPDSGVFNAARIGLLQFGIAPHPSSLFANLRTEPVLSFHARVALCKSLPAGSPISYGKTHTLSKASRIAILSAGYADGISTAFSNRGNVLLHGQSCPIIGRVTMDQTIVDVSQIDPPPAPGSIATFIGSDGSCHISANDFAQTANSIVWESLCAISSRTQRIYLTDSAF